MSVLAGHFSEHLKELRQRLIIAFGAVVVASGVTYCFAEQVTRLFMAPLVNAHPALSRLVYTNLTEAFVSYIKVSLLVGLLVSFPVVLYELWMFVSPGLHKSEKRVALRVVFWATLLFAAGASFAYFVVLPKALHFLMSFASERLKPLPKIDAYLTFVVRSALAFGLAFEIPFLMVVADRTGLVERQYFVAKRTYAYIAIIVLAFLLTAGDVLSALMLGLPLCGLYEAGILVMRLWAKPAA